MSIVLQGRCGFPLPVFRAMSPAWFEKDDDSNGHIDFITAAAVSLTSCDTKGRPEHSITNQHVPVFRKKTPQYSEVTL